MYQFLLVEFHKKRAPRALFIYETSPVIGELALAYALTGIRPDR